MRFNIIILLASLGFGIGNYFVVQLNTERKDGEDCGNLQTLIYVDYVLHGLNLLIALVNLTGLNNTICRSSFVMILLLVELMTLGYK